MGKKLSGKHTDVATTDQEQIWNKVARSVPSPGSGKIPAATHHNPSRIPAESRQNQSRISAESQQHLSRMPAEAQQNLSRISCESSQNPSRIQAASYQNLRRILAESELKLVGAVQATEEALADHVGTSGPNYKVGSSRESLAKLRVGKPRA